MLPTDLKEPRVSTKEVVIRPPGLPLIRYSEVIRPVRRVMILCQKYLLSFSLGSMQKKLENLNLRESMASKNCLGRLANERYAMFIASAHNSVPLIMLLFMG